MKKKSIGGLIFDTVNYTLLTLLMCATLYPFIYVLSASISSPADVETGRVILFPKNMTLESYKMVLENNEIWVSYANTIYYTVLGTLISVFLTVCGAYPISKQRLRGRGFFTFFFAFTLWFGAGMIPTYLNIRELNLYDTRAAVILLGACSSFYIIMVRTNFQSIPQSLEEAAKIDGANDLMILFRIFIPLSKPIIATISLFYAMARWNSYIWPTILLTDINKMPLQVILQKLTIEAGMVSNSYTMSAMGDVVQTPISKETVIYATIMVATIPVIVVYPFVQRYFEQGMMVGSIKG